jgi:hypothetical protein
MAAHHVTVAERLQYFVNLLGNCADRHARELQALKDSLSEHAQDFLGFTKRAYEFHSPLPERISFLEKLLGDNADKHAQVLKILKDARSQHAQDLEEHHAIVEVRKDVEKL